jgi:hypothetical protein
MSRAAHRAGSPEKATAREETTCKPGDGFQGRAYDWSNEKPQRLIEKLMAFQMSSSSSDLDGIGSVGRFPPLAQCSSSVKENKKACHGMRNLCSKMRVVLSAAALQY